MKQHMQRLQQNRKFFMVLPILVFPFLPAIFWALGGGQQTHAQVMSPEKHGFNAELPGAHFEEKEVWDKLSLYEIADRDSAKFEEARESDPYFDLVAFKTEREQAPLVNDTNKLIQSFKTKDRLGADPIEEKVNRKLEELYNEIDKSSTNAQSYHPESVSAPSSPELSSDVSRLEQMMETINTSEGEDPEMKKIEDVLEKILDIQHPERVKEKLKTHTEKNTNTFSVEPAPMQEIVTQLEPLPDSVPQHDDSVVHQAPAIFTNAFYSLDDERTSDLHAGNAIEALIHGTQELVAGATVKLRLSHEVAIRGNLIAQDQFIYGTCAINGERLTISISSIRVGNSLLPVSLAVYDLDGLEGIYIPGAITRDAAKQAGDDAMQSVQLMSLDPTIGQQAAGAGIEAAKGLLSKKTKLIKVTVKAGYQVLLKDTNALQQAEQF